MHTYIFHTQKQRIILLARFLLKMYSKGHSTRKQIQDVVESSEAWSSTSAQLIKGQFNKFLSSLGVSQEKLAQPLVSHELHVLQTLIDNSAEPFRGMATEDQRISQYERQGLVLPTSFVIGQRSEQQKDGTMKLVDAKAQYISIAKTLINYISEDAHPPAKRSHEFVAEIAGYKDGALFKSCDYFKENPNALRLCLYNDDIELANPLGSKAGVHKLTMFYIAIQDCKRSSLLKSIHLVAVCYASDLNDFGYNTVLKPLVDDLKQLDTGLNIAKGNQRQILKARLVQLSGDNLAANQTLGMVASFSASYCCRFCMMSIVDTRHATFQNRSILRNRTLHKRHVEMAAVNSMAYKTTGVKKGSVLDDLHYFSSVEASVPDIMHDILEGVGKRELKQILCAFIHSKLISLKYLNERISTFNFGYVRSYMYKFVCLGVTVGKPQ